MFVTRSTNNMRWLAVVAVLIVGVVAPVVAHAQSRPPARCPDKEKAKRDFVEGRVAYRRGDYATAIIKWQDSFAACEKKDTLYNLGNASERSGKLQAAVEYFERYRPLAEPHEISDLDSRIGKLKTRVAEQDAKEREAQEREARRLAEEEERKRQEEAARQARLRASKTGVVPIIGWSALGVGVAAAVAGVVMVGVASSKRPDEADACLDNGGRLLCRESMRSDIETSNTLALAGDITWIAGAVLGVTGATLLILSASGALKGRQRDMINVPLELRVNVSPGGLALEGVF